MYPAIVRPSLGEETDAGVGGGSLTSGRATEIWIRPAAARCCGGEIRVRRGDSGANVFGDDGFRSGSVRDRPGTPVRRLAGGLGEARCRPGAPATEVEP